jgi:hypothetical protein
MTDCEWSRRRIWPRRLGQSFICTLNSHKTSSHWGRDEKVSKEWKGHRFQATVDHVLLSTDKISEQQLFETVNRLFDLNTISSVIVRISTTPDVSHQPQQPDTISIQSWEANRALDRLFDLLNNDTTGISYTQWLEELQLVCTYQVLDCNMLFLQDWIAFKHGDESEDQEEWADEPCWIPYKGVECVRVERF